jgi:hypothetical protein
VLVWALMPALVLVLMLVLAMMQTMTVCQMSPLLARSFNADLISMCRG